MNMALFQSSALSILKALSDEARLRIVGALIEEPLHVNELLEVLDMGQSRVSRHLRILTEAQILENRRDGAHVYYGLSDSGRIGAIAPLIRALALFQGGSGQKLPLPLIMEKDRIRLEEVLLARKERSLRHFQRYGQQQNLRQEGLVDGAFYRERIASMVDESGVIADLGCGTGELLGILDGKAGTLIGVDQSRNVLQRARESCPRADLRVGTLEHLPLANQEADIVIASMVLHHLPDPKIALDEMRRVLKKNGILIIAELARHDHEEMRRDFADFWLGFDPERLEEYVREAGFRAEKKKRGRGHGVLDCLFYRAKASGRLAQVQRSGSEKKIKKAAVN